jgi:hypothetical protein
MSTHVTYTVDLEDFARVKVGEQVTIASVPAGATNVQVHINSRSFAVSYDLLDTPPAKIEIGIAEEYGAFLTNSQFNECMAQAESKGFREGEAFIKRQIKEKIRKFEHKQGDSDGQFNFTNGHNYCLERVLALLPKD